MRNPGSSVRWIVVFTVALVIGMQTTASAYIDPGSGSYVFQILIGALVGAAVSMKLFWGRIWAFFTRGRTRKD